MVKEEIVEGLRLAVEKGEPLNKAMMSFYNAGYLKAEIEEAARALQVPHFAEMQDEGQLIRNQPPSQNKGSSQNVYSPTYNLQSSLQPPQNFIQRVSDYEGKSKPMSGILIFTLVFSLLFLLGLLVAVFLFKEELTILFNKI